MVKHWHPLGQKTAKTFQKLSGNFEALIDRAMDRRVCLGITGFSGSGKSTLITSLIQQLSHYKNATLPAFSPALQGRLLGVKLHSHSGSVKSFPYDSAIHSLCASPATWPDSTTDIFRCLLELRLKVRPGVIRRPGKKYQSLLVELRDYPGEWLLDLPMMSCSFRQWSLNCDRLYNQHPRLALLGPLKEALDTVDPMASADEGIICKYHEQLVQFLSNCKNSEKPLSMIQPGRFLLPGENDNALPFFPLVNLKHYTQEQLKYASSSSYYKLFNRHYDDYINRLVKPFYKDYFCGIDRQLVVVDVLQALNSGKAWLEDMQLALYHVLKSFSYGHNSIFSRLFTPKVDKLMFIASKIDQVLPAQHENVRAFLGALIFDACSQATFESIDVICEAVSAVRATTVNQHNGQAMLLGNTVNYGAGMMLHPDIPTQLPTPAQWQTFEGWKLQRLLPPADLNLNHGGNLPHIRLDSVIQEMIGNKCK